MLALIFSKKIGSSREIAQTRVAVCSRPRSLATGTGPINPRKFNTNVPPKNMVQGFGQSKGPAAPLGREIFNMGLSATKPASTKAFDTSKVSKDLPRSPTESKPAGITGAASLRPKSARRIVGTDWYSVTSVTDTKYFWNKKTQEYAYKLPQSVIDHIGRLRAAAEQHAVDQNPATQIVTPNSKDNTIGSQTVKKAPSESLNVPVHPPPKPAKSRDEESSAPKAAKTHPFLGIRKPNTSLSPEQIKQLEALDDPGEPPIPSKPSKSEVRRAVLEQELQVAIAKEQLKTPLEFDTSPEKIQELMALDVSSAGIVKKGTSQPVEEEEEMVNYVPQSEKPNNQSSFSALEANCRAISDHADRLIIRGDTNTILETCKSQAANLLGKYDKGLPLSFREKVVLLNNIFIQSKIYCTKRIWSEADKLIQIAKKIDPEHPLTYMSEAYYFWLQNEDIKAIKLLNFALDADPNCVPAMLILVKIYINIGEPDNAMLVLDDVAKIEPKNYLGKVLRAQLQSLIGDFVAASQTVTEAIRLDESRPEAYAEQGKIIMELGKMEAGMAALQMAIDKDRSYGPAYVLLGKALFTQGLNEDAAKCFELGLQFDPYSVAALIGASSICYADQAWSKMLDLSTKAVTIDPYALDAWFNKARAHMELKQWNSAVDSFERCITLQPDNEEAYLFLGACLHGAGRTAECLSKMDQLLQLVPDSPKAFINKGFAYQVLKKLPEALEAFETALKYAPDDQEAKIGKVSVLYALGRSEEASNYYQSFKTDDDQDAYKAAVKMAAMSKTQDLNPPSANPDVDTNQIKMMADLEKEMEKAMSFNTDDATPEEAQKAAEADISSLFQNMNAEIGQLNELLVSMGLNPVSANPNDNTGAEQVNQNFDPSKITDEKMEQYFQFVAQAQKRAEETPIPNPQSPEDWEIAQKIGLTKEMIEQAKAARARTPDDELNELKEEAQEILEMLHRDKSKGSKKL